jgi:hypothetical protein
MEHKCPLARIQEAATDPFHSSSDGGDDDDDDNGGYNHHHNHYKQQKQQQQLPHELRSLAYSVFKRNQQSEFRTGYDSLSRRFIL